MEIIKEKDYNKIKILIKRLRSENKTPVILSESDDLTRKLFENEKNLVIIPTLKNKKDRLYQRESGFDEVMAKFGKKNNNTLGILLDELLNADTKIEKAKILARIKQNIRIAKKARTPLKIISHFHSGIPLDKKNILSLGLVLGLDTTTAKSL